MAAHLCEYTKRTVLFKRVNFTVINCIPIKLLQKVKNKGISEMLGTDEINFNWSKMLRSSKAHNRKRATLCSFQIPYNTLSGTCLIL